MDLLYIYIYIFSFTEFLWPQIELPQSWVNMVPVEKVLEADVSSTTRRPSPFAPTPHCLTPTSHERQTDAIKLAVAMLISFVCILSGELQYE